MLKFIFILSFFVNSNALITYQLYTRNNRNKGQPLIFRNSLSVVGSSYNGERKTKFVIHGYGQSGRSKFSRDMKNAFLSEDDDNVIIVDWSSEKGSSYTTARQMIEPIGKSVAQFIDWLHPKRLHVVGFDLGAHIAGIAGKYTTKERIDRISGLDPNRSGFNVNKSVNRLAAGDAEYVEAFHSNGGKIGIMEHLVDMDYYINDGKSQPDCTTDRCSHYFAAQVFIDHYRGEKFKVKTCESLEELDGIGCGHKMREMFGEKTGMKQIITETDD